MDRRSRRVLHWVGLVAAALALAVVVRLAIGIAARLLVADQGSEGALDTVVAIAIPATVGILVALIAGIRRWWVLVPAGGALLGEALFGVVVGADVHFDSLLRAALLAAGAVLGVLACDLLHADRPSTAQRQQPSTPAGTSTGPEPFSRGWHRPSLALQERRADHRLTTQQGRRPLAS